MKVLFICKVREYSEDYSDWGYSDWASGLLISAKLLSDMLNKIGISSKVVRVVDNNDIDREVHKYRPNYVIIEALWVVPEKFHILRRLHPHVKWVVRIHSEIPFLANEGIAMKWLYGYRDLGFVHIGVNSKRIGEALKGLGFDVLMLPNYYPVDPRRARLSRRGSELRVGCFGAIRPLKNQLMQAIAAIRCAEELKLHLEFHINHNRVENRGIEVLKNIRDLFANNINCELVEHSWMSHHKFIELLKTMDIGMNVSLSETYSVITADMVSHNVPIVVSHEVAWAHTLSKANPNDLDDIVKKMKIAFHNEELIYDNKSLLRLNGRLSKQEWKRFLLQKI